MPSPMKSSRDTLDTLPNLVFMGSVAVLFNLAMIKSFSRFF